MNEFDWTIEREIALFQALKEHPPFALERTSNLLALSSKLSSQFGTDVTVDDIAQKLEQLYGTDTMDTFSFARSTGANRAQHFSLPEEFELDANLNFDDLEGLPPPLPLLSTVLPPIDPTKLSSEDFFLPTGDMFASVPPGLKQEQQAHAPSQLKSSNGSASAAPVQTLLAGKPKRTIKGRNSRRRMSESDESVIEGLLDDEDDDVDDDGREAKPRSVAAKNKKRIRHLTAPSPTSTSKKYKKKKFVEPNPRPDGSIDADDLIDLPRLNEMFNRYMACYEEATREKTGRFGGLTEFVFAILLELRAEDKPVSLTEIYAHAKTIWHKLPEELIKRFQTKDFKGNIRSTLYACQIFIRPGDSQEEKKTWMLRGRPEGSTKGRSRKDRD